MAPTATPERFLVVGMGIAGRAAACALAARGVTVRSVDDHADIDELTAFAAANGFEHLGRLDPDGLEAALATVDAVLPTPGLPESHPVFALGEAARLPTYSEFDLAAAWDDRPIIAITGTNGKTTVTTMVRAMLEASGKNAVDAGNTDIPLVAAIDDPSVDVFVVEASSFRLGHSRHFRPQVACWLNFAPDHLDVHASLEIYEHAKARVFLEQEPSDVAVANIDDPVVMKHVGAAHLVTFGSTGGYRVEAGELRADDDALIAAVADLPRNRSHDLSNALAAAATARHAGADLESIAGVLRSFDGLPHRVQHIATADGISWYNDSKATVPDAARAAITGFESVVLIAGGKNKGLDLSGLRDAADHLRSVVSIGAAAEEIEAAFAGAVDVNRASSMRDAVERARSAAQPGDVVLLSPGCASFDWYANYGARGDDFTEIVRSLTGAST